MLLVLSVKSHKNNPPSFPVVYTFDQNGGRIGRSLNNDWVLQDPDHYISTHHAIIEFKGGKYLIEDISSNGVFINQSTTPLGIGNSIILNAGDCLSIGEYEIYVSFDSDYDRKSASEYSDINVEPFQADICSSSAESSSSATDNNTTMLPIPPSAKHIPEDWWEDESIGPEWNASAPQDKHSSSTISSSIKKEKPEWYSTFRREVERLSIGNMMFNPPSTMRVGITDRVEVRISTDNKEKLLLHLKGRGEPIVEEIILSEFMKVTLRGSAFSINPLNEEEQIVASPDFTEWAWDVLPTTSGKQTLHLLVTARIMLPFGEEQKDHPVIDRDISVLVNPVYSTRMFLRKYWKWIITALLLPFMGWAWKTYFIVP